MGYTITIRNKKKFALLILSFLLLIANNLIACAAALANERLILFYAHALFLGIAVFIFFYVLIYKRILPSLFWVEIFFFLSSVYWIYTSNMYLFFLLVFIGILYSLAQADTVFAFTKSYISRTTIYSIKIPWSTLSNVILKDGILTLDYKSNKIMQQYIDKGDEVGEEEFNHFCQACLRDD